MNAQEYGSYVWILFTYEDRGFQVLMCSMNSDNMTAEDWRAGPQFSLDTWYHVLMFYDADTRVLRADVMRRSTGEKLRSFRISNAGPFGNMNRVGISDIREGTFQVPGAQAKGYFDNVTLFVK
jgi:hypothetical protein